MTSKLEGTSFDTRVVVGGLKGDNEGKILLYVQAERQEMKVAMPKKEALRLAALLVLNAIKEGLGK